MSNPLLGRQAELTDLRERLDAASAGRGGLLIVSGEAGIGKSALVTVVASEAQHAQFRLLNGRAWEFADAPTYFPVRSGLRALGVATPLPAASEADAFGLWEDVLESLAHECAKRPLLWVLEDLHAADVQTLELLLFLAQPLRALAALIIVTVRSGDPRTNAVVLQRLTRLVRDGGLIELEPLAAADVAALVARVARRALPADSVAAWMARTAGNPLFVIECARAVRAGRSLDRALPSSIVQGVLERMRALPAATCSALEQGAVLGRTFDAASVARQARCLPAEIVDRLLGALQAGMLEETAPGHFRFAHALVHDAIYEAMPAVERRACHARFELALADRGDSLDVLVERARHAIEGLGAITDTEVHDRVTRALVALEREGARDRAFALWRRWLATRSVQAGASELLELARLAGAAGNHTEAQHAAQAAAGLARQAGDAVQLAQAALLQSASPQPGMADQTHVQLLEEALSRLSAAAQPRLHCLLRARLAAAMQPSATPEVPVAMARQVLIEARNSADQGLLREVLVFAGSALTFYVPTHESHAVASELAALSLAVDDTPRALRALARRAVSHLELGDFTGFDADTDHALRLARELGHPAPSWRALIVGSMRALARGEFDDSERFVTELEQMTSLIDDPALSLSLTAHKLYRLFALDDEQQIRDARSTIVPQVARVAGDYACSIRALFAVRLNDVSAAAQEIPALLRMTRALPVDSAFQGIVGEVLALAGTHEQREQSLTALLALAARECHTGPVPQTYEGPVARVIGLLEAALGHIDAADARLESARVRCRTFGLRPWVARLSLERGLLMLAAGRSAAGIALCVEAAALAAELGMRGLQARARDASGAEQAGLEVPAGHAVRDAATLTLVREGEVWCVTWAEHVARVRDSRGMELLAKLVAAPGERIHALALSADGFVPESDAGEAIDSRAVAAYRTRLAEIDEAVAVAQSNLDSRGVDARLREREALVNEISRAVGLGGRLRRVGSATERARINVTRRLKDAIARIAEVSPELGRRLQASVRTGTYCCYRETG